ncbi:hypothetical protein V1504DRAFT_31967 [Lipomyces starkeyi]
MLFLGISYTTAWVVVKANEYAGHWSVIRDFERDILSMCETGGMAAPWPQREVKTSHRKGYRSKETVGGNYEEEGDFDHNVVCSLHPPTSVRPLDWFLNGDSF